MVSPSPSVGASAPKLFSFDQSFPVRIVMRDGDPWFYAMDVCAALGIANARDALIKLDADEKSQAIDPDAVGLTDGGEINNLRNIVNESGLYTIILRCRDATKPGTLPHRFRKWVTAEVLPALRKTGRYATAELPDPALPEYLDRETERVLSRLGYLIAHQFRYPQAVSHAFWHRLRQVSGVPAPGRFEMRHLPLLGAEITRLFGVTSAYHQVVQQGEKQVIKRLLREDRVAEPLLATMSQDLTAALAAPDGELLAQIDRWQQHEISGLNPTLRLARAEGGA